MAVEKTTIARPYAEAVFGRAKETRAQDLWSDMLGLLAAVVADPQMTAVIANPRVSRNQLTDLILEIGADRLNAEGQNLVKQLVANGRLSIMPEIAALYERRKSESQGTIDVRVVSAFAMDPAEEQELAAALHRRLGREINITSDKDPALIGGVCIRAGDYVIDGSVRGRLRQLANELEI